MGSIKDKLKEKFLTGKNLSDNSPPSKPKKKRVKARKSNICTTCGEHIIENENKDALRYQNTFHQVQTKKYCDDHESKYTGHKCKPSWCGDCGFLMKYEIEIK